MDGLRTGDCGYHEIAHTADWALIVWAPDLVRLLETAAAGMYSLLGVEWIPGERTRRMVEIEGADAEGLLVSFLSELLYLVDTGLAFDKIQITITDDHLSAVLDGGPIGAPKKEIKAVTYHQLAILPVENGLQVTVVFDV